MHNFIYIYILNISYINSCVVIVTLNSTLQSGSGVISLLRDCSLCLRSVADYVWQRLLV